MVKIPQILIPGRVNPMVRPGNLHLFTRSSKVIIWVGGPPMFFWVNFIGDMVDKDMVKTRGFLGK